MLCCRVLRCACRQSGRAVCSVQPVASSMWHGVQVSLNLLALGPVLGLPLTLPAPLPAPLPPHLQVMSKTGLPALASIMMLVQAALSTPMGLLAKRVGLGQTCSNG